LLPRLPLGIAFTTATHRQKNCYKQIKIVTNKLKCNYYSDGHSLISNTASKSEH